MDRESAYALLREYTKGDFLIKHALGVEAALRAYARHYGEDEETWGIIGLLHDFDFEAYPDPHEHTVVGRRILAERGYPPDVIYAVTSHSNTVGPPRVHLVDKVLYACDELVGFIHAVALVQPTKSVHSVEARSVRKKLKDKGFARAINRQEIDEGIADLGVPFDEHVAFVIAALRGVADQIGLAGMAHDSSPPDLS